MKRLTLFFIIFHTCILTFSLEFGTSDVYAQIGGTEGIFGDTNTGTYVLPALLVPIGGRYEGMGTAFTAVSDDSGYIESNPSASALLAYTELSVLHKNWIDDARGEGVVYTVRFNELGIGFGGKFLYAPFTETGFWGERRAVAYYSESVATVNISYNFFSSYRFYGIALGTNLKFAYRNVPNNLVPAGYDTQSALAVLADIGTLTRFNFLKFYPSRAKNFSLGLVVKNLGPNVQNEALPTQLTVGVAYSPIRPITVSYDLDLPLYFGFDQTGLEQIAESLSMAGGINVVLTDFFSMQAGFNYRGANPRISLGAAVDLVNISFVVNYTLDLATQFDTLDRISIEATLNLGDKGRVATQLRVDELYLAGVEAYAAGEIDSAIEYWSQVLEIDPKFDPARSFLELARTQKETREKLESIR